MAHKDYAGSPPRTQEEKELFHKSLDIIAAEHGIDPQKVRHAHCMIDDNMFHGAVGMAVGMSVDVSPAGTFSVLWAARVLIIGH